MNKASETIDPARFDVREIPCRIKHGQILQRWADLPVGGYFVLVNDHDPVPLYHQFAAEFPGAFTWDYEVSGPDVFEVRIGKVRAVDAAVFSRQSVKATCGERAQTAASTGTVADVDARGMEPPEPLIRILLALESLPAGQQLRALTDREPCHLFREAAQRGFRHQSNEQPDGSWVTLLQRA
jgi:uncharacterized protein (DUF2249 family)